MSRWASWGYPLAFLVLSLILIGNSVFLKSVFVGLPIALALIFVGATATGDVFFPIEGLFRRVLGLATFIMILALIGAALSLAGRFTETLSLALVALVGLFLCCVSSLQRGRSKNAEGLASDLNRLGIRKEIDERSLFLFLFFVVCVGVSFVGLLRARTGEGGASVWLTIPTFFIPVFFVSALSLMLILFFTRLNVGLKLILVIVFFLLAESLFVVVWYPGKYGDQWLHLGEATYIDESGKRYNYDVMIRNLLSGKGTASALKDLIGSMTQYALVVLFQRMFSVDIYWVHIVLVPVLWAVFVPLFSYKITELISSRKSRYVSFLGALGMFLSPVLIDWGTISVPNTVGFLFFVFTILLLLYWMDRGGRKIWLLALLAAVTTLLAHPQPGIIAGLCLVSITGFKKLRHGASKFAFYILLLASYPVALYLQGARFSLGGALTLEPLIYFQGGLFSLIFVLGLFGILAGFRSRRIKPGFTPVLLSFYVAVQVGFFVSAFWMVNLPFSAVRILAMADLLFLPFAALGLLAILAVLKSAFSGKAVISLKWTKTRPIGRFLPLLLICIFLSAQATFSLYQAYPHNEIVKVQPAAYEIEAIRYIDSAARGRYVVLWNLASASLAIGFLGSDYTYGGNPHGLVGVPERYYPTYEYFEAMVSKPSFKTMETAMTFASANVAYFVTSIRDYDYEHIVQRVSEVLPVDHVFGDGKLTVFKYPLPTFEGAGPEVKVLLDNGSTVNHETSYSYMVKGEVTYNLTLSGHSSYNITGYPKNWAFTRLTVNTGLAQFNEMSNIDEFVYVNGLSPSDVLTVFWQANDNYPEVMWKDETFRSGWRTHHLYAGTIYPNITTDGNVLSLSWNFTTGRYQYYYYERLVNVSAGDTRYVIVRWKSTAGLAVISLDYDQGAQDIAFGGESADWSRVTAEVPSDRVLKYITVGMSNLLNMDLSGLQTLYVDYILVVARGSAQ